MKSHKIDASSPCEYEHENSTHRIVYRNPIGTIFSGHLDLKIGDTLFTYTESKEIKFVGRVSDISTIIPYEPPTFGS